MRPGDLLAAQQDLVRRWDDDEFKAVVSGSLLAAANQRQDAEGLDAALDRGLRGDFRGYEWVGTTIQHATRASRNAEVYDVVRPMVALTEWAAATMEDLTPFDHTLPPSEWGLCHFDGGINLTDAHGQTLIMDWLLWFPAHLAAGRLPNGMRPTLTPGVAMVAFNDMIANPDDLSRELRASGATADIWEHLGRWGYTGFGIAVDGDRIGPAMIDAGLVWNTYQFDEDSDDRVPSTNLSRLVTALWTIMREPVVSLREERPDRAAQKRARRMKMPEAVTVITLRHLVERGDPRGEVEWQHHWVVRGHYRWQACGPRREHRRLIYIAPHMKGNMEAPLLQTKKVHRLAR